MTNKLEQRKINHVAFVIDESGSMGHLRDDVVKVFDSQVKWLLDLSQQMKQETRVTIYTLGGNGVKCPLFDTDVHHLPSLAGNYWPAGGTPLIDATLKSIEDLKQTAQMYGDHGFLIFVLTDGGENASTSPVPGFTARPGDFLAVNQARVDFLANTLKNLPENWTLGCLVHDFNAKILAQSYGFDAGNIAIWNTSSAQGLADAGDEIREATSSYFTAREAGVRGTKTLFTKNVTKADVKAAGLKPLDTDKYLLLNVIPTKGITITIPKKTVLKSRPDGLPHVEIMEFIQANNHAYVTGNAYYELVKSEKIDGNKKVLVVENATGLVYGGPEARKLVGLDMYSRRAKPMPIDKATGKREFDIFIQSTSTNRLLPVHTSRVLLIVK